MADAFRALVQASSDVPGRGTVAVVLVEAGAIQVGDFVDVPAGTRAEVIAIEVFAQDEEDQGGPAQLGLLLTGVDRSAVPRGARLTVT